MQHHKSIAGQLYGQALQGLCDDLNSPVAISTLSGPLKQLNDLIHTKKVIAGISSGLESGKSPIRHKGVSLQHTLQVSQCCRRPAAVAAPP